MSDPTTTAIVSPDPARKFLGHPLGLVTLFGTEFFERFTYYGMRALLVLFLVAATTGANPGFGVDAATAGAVYGLYTGAVYLGCVPGGWIADRLIGQRNAVFWGGVIIAVGNFILSIPASAPVFYLGLAVIVVGVGLLKPNISAMVGALYEGQPGARRDAGFSIFYMGINLGAFVSAAGRRHDRRAWNWRGGFSAAGLGMLFGVVQFQVHRLARHTPGMRPACRHVVRSGAAGRSCRRSAPCIAAVVAWMFFAGSPVRSGSRAVVRHRRCSRSRCSSSAMCCSSPSSTRPRASAWRDRDLLPVRARCSGAASSRQATSFNLFAERLHRSLGARWLFPTACIRRRGTSRSNPLFIILFAPFFAGSGCTSARATSILPRRRNWASAWSSRRRLPGDDVGRRARRVERRQGRPDAGCCSPI